MEDFASSAMMRLVRQGLLNQGIAPGAAPPRGAHIALTEKRALLGDVLSRHGPLAILRIGDAIAQMPPEPVLVALGAAASPGDLLDRWTRLERFMHARHRLVQEEAATTAVVLRHVSRLPGQAPRLEETLLIIGVVVALMRWIGVRGVRARPCTQRAWAYRGAWRQAPDNGACTPWEVRWDQSDPRPLKPPSATGPVQRMRTVLSADLTRRWTITALARDLGLSGRSLQRSLQDHGTTFSAIVQDVRTTAAAERLQSSSMTLGEIGFLCGFSDQGHFTRSFKAATATTPGTYRQLFSGAEQPPR